MCYAVRVIVLVVLVIVGVVVVVSVSSGSTGSNGVGKMVVELIGKAPVLLVQLRRLHISRGLGVGVRQQRLDGRQDRRNVINGRPAD
jgi:hypothetical protein